MKHDLRRSLVEMAQKFSPLETGGVLLGYWRADRLDVVILHAVGPGPEARHFADRFVPDYRFHVAEVARAYETSGRLTTYLGDWHSHPDGSAELSQLDRQTLSKMSRSRTSRIDEPMMVVLAGDDGFAPAVWIRRRIDRSVTSVARTVRCTNVRFYE